MQEIRNRIDEIDLEIRKLVAQRMDCSYKVAEAKQASGNTTIYRADREQQILDKLGADVAEDRRAEYLAIVRKVMETSRMYQYGLIYEWNPDAFTNIQGSELADVAGHHLVVRLTRPNRPNAMSAVLSMIGDYGFNMEAMELVEETPDTATFTLTIRGDITETRMRKLVFQLSKESDDFAILKNE